MRAAKRSGHSATLLRDAHCALQSPRCNGITITQKPATSQSANPMPPGTGSPSCAQRSEAE